MSGVRKPLFKIGDFVTINLDPDKSYPAGQNHLMRMFNGRKMRIVGWHKSNYINGTDFYYDGYWYELQEDRNNHIWTTPMFLECQEI